MLQKMEESVVGKKLEKFQVVLCCHQVTVRGKLRQIPEDALYSAIFESTSLASSPKCASCIVIQSNAEAVLSSLRLIQVINQPVKAGVRRACDQLHLCDYPVRIIRLFQLDLVW